MTVRRVATLGERERRVMTLIESAPNRQSSAMRLARRLGYRSENRGVLPVTSTLRALERRGLTGHFPWPGDEWSVAYWYVTKAGRDLLEEGTATS